MERKPILVVKGLGKVLNDLLGDKFKEVCNQYHVLFVEEESDVSFELLSPERIDPIDLKSKLSKSISQKDLESMMETELEKVGANFGEYYIDDHFGTVSGAMAEVLKKLGINVTE